MVTGRQKIEGSELKRVKASCSSEETGRLLVSQLGKTGYKLMYHLPVIPDCMVMLVLSPVCGGVVYEGRER
jgi:hypothetical protein